MIMIKGRARLAKRDHKKEGMGCGGAMNGTGERCSDLGGNGRPRGEIQWGSHDRKMYVEVRSPWVAGGIAGGGGPSRRHDFYFGLFNFKLKSSQIKKSLRIYERCRPIQKMFVN